ncbi:MAG: hypothetical protein Q6373_001765 [Candidatus Sigynarchaeota archaeon]
MKTVKVSFLDRALRQVIKDDTPCEVDDNADVLDVLARIDEDYMKRTIKAKRGQVVVRSIMQLVWNARDGTFFEDVGIEGRDPARNWVPCRTDPLAPLPDGTSIWITTDPGC